MLSSSAADEVAVELVGFVRVSVDVALRNTNMCRGDLCSVGKEISKEEGNKRLAPSSTLCCRRLRAGWNS